jgi:peptidoglycan/xylan/chitin deacetylase (PgdA/CDA1 family)
MVSRRFLLKLAALGSAFAASPAHAASSEGLYAPILMYHHIDAEARSRFATTPDAFRAQMRWLAANGFVSVSVDDIAASLRGGPPLPPKPVAITFDDGWRSQFVHGVTVLQEFGLRATFYLVARYIVPGDTFMHWRELDVLAGNGHWFGSHSGRHEKQTGLGRAALAADMAAVRNLLRARMGIVPTTHAYPFGAANTTVHAAARAAGYVAAVGVWNKTHQNANAIYSLRRIEVHGGMTMPQFELALGGA